MTKKKGREGGVGSLYTPIKVLKNQEKNPYQDTNRKVKSKKDIHYQFCKVFLQITPDSNIIQNLLRETWNLP